MVNVYEFVPEEQKRNILRSAVAQFERSASRGCSEGEIAKKADRYGRGLEHSCQNIGDTVRRYRRGIEVNCEKPVSTRVGEYCMGMARTMGLSPDICGGFR